LLEDKEKIPIAFTCNIDSMIIAEDAINFLKLNCPTEVNEKDAKRIKDNIVYFNILIIGKLLN
jgi:hypothetical protein